MAALRLGRILVNGRQVESADYKLRHNDAIHHIHHKHEHPILDEPIKIIAETDDMLVVNKPPSLPVHACGQYKLCTVMGLLWKLHGRSGLRCKCLIEHNN
jgi:23S rRNA-/tRNA-specific pseudouridylate synthase